MPPTLRSASARTLTRVAMSGSSEQYTEAGVRRRLRWVTIYRTKYRLGNPNPRVESYMKANGYDTVQQMLHTEQLPLADGGSCSLASALGKVYVGSTSMTLRRRDNARANDFFCKEYRGTFPELGRRLIFDIGFEYGDDLHFDTVPIATLVADVVLKAHLVYEDYARCQMMVDYCTGVSQEGLHSASFDTVAYSVAEFHRSLETHGSSKTLALLTGMRHELMARFNGMNPFTAVHRAIPGYTVDDWGCRFPGER